MHLVFGHINDHTVTIHKNVKASFCGNGQRFAWEKKENDEVVEEFIDPDTAVPPEWLKKCHEVRMDYSKGANKYVSVKQGKTRAVSQPKPVVGPRAAKPSNVKMIQKDGSFKDVGTGKGNA